MGKTEPKINWKQPQPAPKALWQLVSANVPKVRNLGIYNNRNVAGTSTPSAHAEGRALDIGLNAFDESEKYLGNMIFGYLIEAATEMGLDHVIWNRQIWTPGKGINGYHGKSAHTDHIHVAFTREGSQKVYFPKFQMLIAVFRTGLEDLRRANANIA